MDYQLRDYQQIAVTFALKQLAEGRKRLLFAAPTGSGKSRMELALQQEAERAGYGPAWIITPRIEIIAGMLRQQGVEPPASDERIAETAGARRITTPIRLRSLLLAGTFPDAPRLLIVDESHHDTADTYTDLALLCGNGPAVGFTATPYRGTPKGTAALLKLWGEPQWVLTYREAADRGVISLPSCRVLPLVDDDLIEVQNGELVASQIEAATLDRLDFLADHCQQYFCHTPDAGLWDRPTMFSCPTRYCAQALTECLRRAYLPACMVLGNDGRAVREAAFGACVKQLAALVQVQVVSEGVDLPIRRLIDLSPCLSPVKWLQQLGRVTRPVARGEEPPEYVCTNRNLLRHGYLLAGCLPPAAFKQSEEAFGASRRLAVRVLGLEALGRLKGVELPLKEGLIGVCYSMSAMEGSFRREYFVAVHPMKEEPLWATRVNETDEGKTVSYGRWQRCEPPADLTGFASLPPAPISEKQESWWKRSAGRFGLDPEAKITRKVFPALPVLSELRVRL